MLTSWPWLPTFAQFTPHAVLFHGLTSVQRLKTIWPWYGTFTLTNLHSQIPLHSVQTLRSTPTHVMLLESCVCYCQCYAINTTDISRSLRQVVSLHILCLSFVRWPLTFDLNGCNVTCLHDTPTPTIPFLVPTVLVQVLWKSKLSGNLSCFVALLITYSSKTVKY